MSRLVFDRQPPAPPVNPGRADVACFVGLARVWPGAAASSAVAVWLGSLGYKAAQIAALFQVPLPFDSYSAFTAIFDDGTAGNGNGTDFLAAAVRSFFAQGGKLCYVVCTGSPVGPGENALSRALKLAAILPNPGFAPDLPLTWTGVSALSALLDVSFLSTPDLPVLSASQPPAALGQAPVQPTGPEEFVVCSTADFTAAQRELAATMPAAAEALAPRLTTQDYLAWAGSVAQILDYLAAGAFNHQPHLREVQYVAAFPLPQETGTAVNAESVSGDELAQDIHEIIDQVMPPVPADSAGALPNNLSSAFLQLAYPWLKTTGSNVLLESLEPPDGVLTGLLARNALTRGAFTSATKIVPGEIYDVWPDVPPQDLLTPESALQWGTGWPQIPLIERLSLFGFTPLGLRLLSDVTAYAGESYRPAPVNRLVSVICRAARHMGETAVFENNGPALWGKVRRFLENLLTRLWSLDALDGDSANQAFTVRCDRSTMTQNDIDNGRMIAIVTFTPASLIETIHVQLAFETSGSSAQEIAANLAEAS